MSLYETKKLTNQAILGALYKVLNKVDWGKTSIADIGGKLLDELGYHKEEKKKREKTA